MLRHNFRMLTWHLDDFAIQVEKGVFRTSASCLQHFQLVAQRATSFLSEILSESGKWCSSSATHFCCTLDNILHECVEALFGCISLVLLRYNIIGDGLELRLHYRLFCSSIGHLMGRQHNFSVLAITCG